MDYSYLDMLPLSELEKRKIIELAAETPGALLGIIMAAPKAFNDLLGKERSAELTIQLKSMLSTVQQKAAKTPLRSFPGTGAIIRGGMPILKAPTYDIEERDKIFAELQQLKQEEPSSENQCRREELNVVSTPCSKPIDRATLRCSRWGAKTGPIPQKVRQAPAPKSKRPAEARSLKHAEDNVFVWLDPRPMDVQ